MTARDQILARLRAVQPQLPRPTASPVLQPSSGTPELCVQRFRIEAAALGVECYVEPSPDAVRQRVSSLTQGRRMLAWDAAQLPYDVGATLPDALLSSASYDLQATADIGLTGCDAAIAETASLVMISGPGRSRTVSLLPPVHIAIVERSQLVFTMAEIFQNYGDRIATAASCTIITGPSRTADIELTLTLGIHGPGRVITIIGP